MIIPNLAVRIAASVLCVPPESISLMLPMMAPVPTSPAELRQREAVDELLLTGWREEDGFDAPPEEEDYVDSVGRGLNDGTLLRDQSAADILGVLGVLGVTEDDGGGGSGRRPDAATTGSRPSTYGEVTSLGARQLFHYMGMTTASRSAVEAGREHSDRSKGAVFYDLGSGAGRLVVQSYLELPNLAKAVGIELAPARHSSAVRAWEGLVASGEAERVRRIRFGRDGSGREGNGAVELHQGDLYAFDVSDATHIYAASLCFTDGMMAKLAAKLDAGAPELKCVATLKRFPLGSLFGIESPRSEFVEMSWTKSRGEGCTVYFYDRAQEDRTR